MLTPKATDRANILDICSHWWINEGYETSCLDEADSLENNRNEDFRILYAILFILCLIFELYWEGGQK